MHLQAALIQSNASISVNQKKESIVLNEQKEGEIVLDLCEPTYALLQVGYAKNQLYLEPGKDIDLTLISNEDGSFDFSVNRYIYKGENASINEYLNKEEWQFMADEDFMLDEEAYLAKLSRLNKVNTKLVKRQKFSKEFEDNELMRLKYLLYEPLTRYSIQHFWEGGTRFSGVEQYGATPKVNAYISTLFVDTKEAWNNYAYREFLSSAIAVLSLPEGGLNLDSQINAINRLKYLPQHFETPEILEDLTQRIMIGYIEMTEGENLTPELEYYYDLNVKDESLRSELLKRQAIWKKLSSDFDIQSSAYHDVNGEVFNLQDLKGKYIYIDVWATWCGPCCAELPYLKSLEEKFKDKEIYFVSISIDANKAAWMKMVEKEQLGGIQLHGGADAQILKEFNIVGIPRFILLDREGKVIDKNMTRPSDPVTEKRLNELEGI